MPITSYELNYHQNGCNLLIKKGVEGNEKAVDELVSQGGKLTDAVYGYALGGHEELVEKVLEDHLKLIQAAAKGYARAQNIAQITKLRSNEALKASLVFGFAQAGDESQVRAALNARNGTQYLPIVLEGLASTGHKELLCELITGTHYYNTALKAAAKSRHHDLVKVLLARLNINLDEPASTVSFSEATQDALAYVLQGYSEGRHFTEAAEILSRGINPMHCLNALSPSGSLDLTDASLLLSSIDNDRIKTKVSSLMARQFDLNVDALDSAPKARLAAAELSDLMSHCHANDEPTSRIY
ncbi:hypothetical protein [Legionella yabuuchiae]|uniref:hypothetical protein n=1 Tax=Legionella yabuuchiae TaxID=376727 RepID=UPI0010554EB3|nr:hypothetical protein [Legionella yabuuchiae]